MTLAPNPVHNKLTIKVLSGNVIITISNTIGQTMLQTMVSNVTSYTIDIAGYEPGIYLVQTKNEHGQLSSNKVVKQ